MLQMSTLLLQKLCWLSVRNLVFRGNLPWIEAKIVLFLMKYMQIFGQKIQILKFYSTLRSQKLNTLLVGW